jgi:hypothetical protein
MLGESDLEKRWQVDEDMEAGFVAPSSEADAFVQYIEEETRAKGVGRERPISKLSEIRPLNL